MINQGPSIRIARNDEEALAIINGYGGKSFDNIEEALLWISQQEDVLVQDKSFDSTITDGLICYIDGKHLESYPLSGDSVFDLSSNNLDDTILKNGCDFSSTMKGSFYLDGTDDYIDIPYNTFGTGNFTISSIIRFTNSISSLFIFDTYSGTPRVSFRTSSDGYFGFRIRGHNGIETVDKYCWVTGTTCGTFRYYEFVGVRDGDYVNAYVNGIYKSSLDGALNIIPQSGRDSIGLGSTGPYGTQNPYPGGSFQGYVNNFKIYNKALTDDEVLYNFYRGNIVTSGLTIYVDASHLCSYDTYNNYAFDLMDNVPSINLQNGVGYETNTWVFDGVNDIISLSSTDANILTGFTCGVWVKLRGTPSTSYHSIFQKLGGYSGAMIYGVRVDSSGYPYTHISYSDQIYDKSDNITSDVNIMDDQWHYISIKFDENDMLLKIYVDGNFTNQTLCTDIPYQNTNSIHIGTGDGRYAYANISSLKIYNRVLSDGEIRQNYRAHRYKYI